MRVFYASFWRRFWAMTLDLIVILVAWGTFEVATNGNNVGGLLALFFVVYTVGLTMEGGTIGKRMLGLRVVRTNGDEIDAVRAFVREILGRPVSSLSFCMGFLWMLDDPQRRTWHDRFADTVVVRELPVAVGPDWHASPPWRRPKLEKSLEKGAVTPPGAGGGDENSANASSGPPE